MSVDIELRPVAMPGHGDIGQMPVHRSGRQHKGAIDRRPLVLVNRRRIAVVNGLVIIDRYIDDARTVRSPRISVELNLYCVRLDGLNGP
ncbi:hypothetical protein CN127_21535 [Sinorhizobium meliloti]|nr:hypothetical protein CN127_21535 [Sinorhizobium meliloti]